MKKVIFGLALFAGSFALANEPIKNGETDLKAESQQPATIQEEEVAADCGCEVVESPDGICTVTVMHGNGTSTQYGPYSGYTLAQCRALRDSFAP